jgi:hypothetical protein
MMTVGCSGNGSQENSSSWIEDASEKQREVEEDIIMMTSKTLKEYQMPAEVNII